MKNSVRFIRIFRRLTVFLTIILVTNASVPAGVVTVWGYELSYECHNLINDFYNSLAGHSSSIAPDSLLNTIDLTATDLLWATFPRIAYTAAELNAMSNFIAGGGRIAFLGEYWTETENNNINAALSFLGSSIVIRTYTIDAGTRTASVADGQIISHPLTAGVNTYQYAAFAPMTISGTAQALMLGEELYRDNPAIMMAYQEIGAGSVFVITDQNPWYDAPTSWPDGFDNGRMFKNLLTGGTTVSDSTYPLTALVTENGYINLSLDAFGTADPSGGNIQVDKPKNATVRCAYLVGATVVGGPKLLDGEVSINGVEVTWQRSIVSSIKSCNHWADVTSLVKPFIDASPAGIIDLLIFEKNTAKTDGVILAVIFDDPNQTARSTVVLFFGAQNVAGDDFYIRYAEPINRSVPNLRLDFSLGISWSHQSKFSPQYSIIDVNGKRLTTAAGGEDDASIGSLITVGGIGDSNANPVDPYAIPDTCLNDDELYSLIPFVSQGDMQTHIFSKNPSNDDNICFAALFTSVTSIVGEGILLTPVVDTNLLGTTDTLTATVQNDLGKPVIGRQVIFEILSGPHAGLKDTVVTNSSGKALFIYAGASSGKDEIVATMKDASSMAKSSDHAYHLWIKAASSDPPIADAGPDRSVFAGAACSANVTLDGSGSSDPDGGSIVSYAWFLPSGVPVAGATPNVTLPIGINRIILTVTDDEGDSAKDTVFITVANRKPVLGRLVDTTIDEGTSLCLRVTAGDNDGTVPRLTASGLPVGATFADSGNGAGLFSWNTGSNSHGVYSVTLTASDCADSVGGSFTVTVRDSASLPQPPQLAGGYYADANADGMVDAVYLKFTGAVSIDSLSVLFSWPGAGAPQIGPLPGVSLSYGSADRATVRVSIPEASQRANGIRTSGKMSATTRFTAFPDETWTAEVIDSAAPVIDRAICRKGMPGEDDRPGIDTLLVWFSERVVLGTVSNPFTLIGDSATAYSPALEFRSIQDNYAVFTVKSGEASIGPENGDSIYINPISAIADSRTWQINPANRRVKLTYEHPSYLSAVEVVPIRTPGKDPMDISGIKGKFGIMESRGKVVAIETKFPFDTLMEDGEPVIDERDGKPAFGTAKIYDAVGNLVKDELYIKKSAMEKVYYVFWDGTNRNRRRVADGAYLMSVKFAIEKDQAVKSRKLALRWR